MHDARSLVRLIETAAEAAANVIRQSEPRRASLDWREKGTSDFVTEVDVNAESMAVEILRRAEPDAAFLAEESSAGAGGAEHASLRFIIDPLDGTTNFIHGVPDYAVSIGAMVDGVLTAAVVHNVPRREIFTAARGAGAFLHETRLSVSRISEPRRALIGTGFPFRDPADIPAYLQQMVRVMAGSSGIRRAGAASIDLAHVAAGRLDGFWENSLAPWDVAAGILLIREAGGVCTHLDGTDATPVSGSYVAGNRDVHAWLLGQVGSSGLRALDERPN